MSDQIAQEKSNPPPWKPAIAKQIAKMYADEKAGHPFEVIDHCFPTGMPSWMLITHNAFEVLFTPGRVTILGEGDGNRMRRIYTDGRPHPPDPDPSFHGHSVGHWEGGTLVIDTIAVLPQAYLAVNEAVGVPNNGDMHIVERMHLRGRIRCMTIWTSAHPNCCPARGTRRASTIGSAPANTTSSRACASRAASGRRKTATATIFSPRSPSIITYP